MFTGFYRLSLTRGYLLTNVKDMHEFSIACNIVEMVDEIAEKEGAIKVDELELDVGLLSGIIPEALQMALDSAVKNSKLQDAGIIINLIEGKAKCENCGTGFVTNDLFSPCPSCGSFNPLIIEGKDLKIKSLKIDR